MDHFLRQKLGPLNRHLGRIMERAEGRLAFLQGYLHSDDSGYMEMSLSSGNDSPQGVKVSAFANPRTRRVIRAVVTKLTRHARQTGFIPMLPFLRVETPGRGFHSGGSFPMAFRTGERKVGSDLLGRPFGLQRVHVVDSSVFPSIPATTITLTAMANAHRIASEAAGMDR